MRFQVGSAASLYLRRVFARLGHGGRPLLHLYRKVGAGSWADYCLHFLASPATAMGELIEGVRILKGREPARTGIHADEAILREQDDTKTIGKLLEEERQKHGRRRREAAQIAGQHQAPAPPPKAGPGR